MTREELAILGRPLLMRMHQTAGFTLRYVEDELVKAGEAVPFVLRPDLETERERLLNYLGDLQWAQRRSRDRFDRIVAEDVLDDPWEGNELGRSFFG